jgi:hypothetical protein
MSRCPNSELSYNWLMKEPQYLYVYRNNATVYLLWRISVTTALLFVMVVWRNMFYTVFKFLARLATSEKHDAVQFQLHVN